MKSSILKKLSIVCLSLACGAVFAAEDSIGDCIKQVDRWLKSEYSESPRAYEYESKKLNRILGSAKSDEEKIAEMKKTFPRAFQKEEKPLIVQQPLSWNIHSLSLAYDIKQGAQFIERDKDVLTELENRKRASGESKSKDIVSGHHIKAGVDGGVKAGFEAEYGAKVQATASFNPLKWLKNEVSAGGSTKLNFKAVVDLRGSYAYGRDSVSKSSEVWSKSQQNTFSREQSKISEIIRQQAISNRHLTFTLTVTNNTNEQMTVQLNGAYIPVYMGNTACNKHAKPYGQDVTEITIGAKETKDIVFRMELDTTTALQLVGFMCNDAPTIDITRGNLRIWSNSCPDAVAACRKRIESRSVKLRLLNFYAQWNIRRYHTSDSHHTTLRDALKEIDDDIHHGWEHHIFTLRNKTLYAISDIPFDVFSAEDKDERYLAFLQIGDKVYSDVPAELLDKPLPRDGIVLWVVDLNKPDDYKNYPDLQKVIIEKLKRLAENGSVATQFRLGVRYANGSGVPKDEKQAVYWYKKAAEQGLIEAQYRLGLCYFDLYRFDCPDIEKFYSEVEKWLTKAAVQGYAPAQFALGEFYAYDVYEDGDLKKAAYWYRKAAEQGFEPAKKALNRLGY